MIFITILGIILLAVLIVLVLAIQRPDDFIISRTLSIKAKPESIFPLINDFHDWQKWSPYEHMDTNLKKTFSGSQKGIGAIYEYEGEKTGAGKMEMIESVEPSEIVSKLTLIKPMQADNIAKFALESKGDFTEVTWSMTGKNMLINKVAGLFLDIDKLVGKDFEKGLENIKAIVEKA